MADDEDYWNSTSTGKAFDFGEDVSGGGDSVLRLFGVSSQPSPHRRQEEEESVGGGGLAIPEDVRSNASDETRSVRSDVGEEDTSRPPSVVKSVISRTSSVLSGGGRAPPLEALSSSATSTTLASSAGKSTNQVVVGTLKSSSAASGTTEHSRSRLESSSSSHSQLSAEVRHLKRNLEVSRKDQWIKLTPKEMVWRIMQNKPYSLENYRSVEEKVALLDEALNLHDTGAILIAVLHMKNTLSDALFLQEIFKKPDAVDQYLLFMKNDGRYQDCLNFLESLGRPDEAASLQLEMALHCDDIKSQLKELETAIKRQPSTTPTRPSDISHLKKFQSLLEIQRPIEEHDEKASKDTRTNEVFIQHPRHCILGLSLIQTLFYCCMYHFDKPETSFCSPHFLRRTFAISEKQFVWTALNALSQTQKWTEIQALLTDKTGWFGQPKPKAVIGFDRVVDTLIRNGTPPDVLAYYLRLIEDPEERLEYSLRCKCHSVAIDTFVALKEFVRLQEYATKFDAASEEFRYCQEVLQRHSVR